jgi:hypothetical protein
MLGAFLWRETETLGTLALGLDSTWTPQPLAGASTTGCTTTWLRSCPPWWPDCFPWTRLGCPSVAIPWVATEPWWHTSRIPASTPASPHSRPSATPPPCPGGTRLSQVLVQFTSVRLDFEVYPVFVTAAPEVVHSSHRRVQWNFHGSYAVIFHGSIILKIFLFHGWRAVLQIWTCTVLQLILSPGSDPAA